ncbi:unnamed protein product [Linum trigynum]|uniref:Uncharacterized protein n=1 Tax=Linum trigynum TaxID=586398 RepID=A0AAV2E7T5_9ROSI
MHQAVYAAAQEKLSSFNQQRRPREGSYSSADEPVFAATTRFTSNVKERSKVSAAPIEAVATMVETPGLRQPTATFRSLLEVPTNHRGSDDGGISSTWKFRKKRNEVINSRIVLVSSILEVGESSVEEDRVKSRVDGGRVPVDDLVTTARLLSPTAVVPRASTIFAPLTTAHAMMAILAAANIKVTFVVEIGTPLSSIDTADMMLKGRV